jgi:ring-1,2-phenylacetyl-CoA epoxidase subunit PaaE
VRRTYSICSERGGRHLRIGVRVQDEGGMSHHLARKVRVGDVLEIMPPTGRFIVPSTVGIGRSYCAFASGSGITPILGIMRELLAKEPVCRFHLFYGNRSMSTVMFAEDLLALKDRYLERLSLTFVLSREEQEVELCNGRLDQSKVALLGKSLFDPAAVDAYFLCGPGSMLADVKQGLVELGVPDERIHMERFNVRTGAARANPAVSPATQADVQVTVVADGRQRHFGMKKGDVTVLEAAEAAGLSLPYSCRAGVCSTCRAKVTRGAVSMQTNYALEPWELEQGFVLCCQAIPTTAELELNYDER